MQQAVLAAQGASNDPSSNNASAYLDAEKAVLAGKTVTFPGRSMGMEIWQKFARAAIKGALEDFGQGAGNTGAPRQPRELPSRPA